MPIERRVRPGGGRLRLDDIGISLQLCFASGWHPAGRFGDAWPDYRAYLSDWQQVRDVALSAPHGCFAAPDREGWHFAEAMLRVFGPDGPPALLSTDAIRDALH